MDPLTLKFSVACSPERAFAVWTELASLWWPTDHKMSADREASVTYEPRQGGRIYERTGDGSEMDWGEVLDWQPPGRLRYLWHIGTDRSRATIVEIEFLAGAEGMTDVTIVHSGWEVLAGGEEARAGNRRGWGDVLPPFVEACAA